MTAETGGGAGTSRNPDLNPHEQTSDSSETEVSGDDEDDDDDEDVNLDSELSDSGSETGDEDDDWNESRSSESDDWFHPRSYEKPYGFTECSSTSSGPATPTVPQRTTPATTPQQTIPQSVKDFQEPDIDWDVAAEYSPDVDGAVVVPEFDSPVTEEQHAELQLLLAQNWERSNTKELYLLCREYVNAALSDKCVLEIKNQEISSSAFFLMLQKKYITCI
nr:ribosome biogenesis protein BOP1 homolog isoform X2 [Nothobranchius furzeri]